MAIIKTKPGYDEEMDSQREEQVRTPALLPKSVLMGKGAEVGDKLVLRIDKIMEDEIAVSYSSTPDKEPETPPETGEEGEQDITPPEEASPEPAAMSGYDD